MDLAPSRLAESAATGIGLSGTVGISLSEGFGTSFVARYLPQFLAAHPALTVDLVASSGFLSPSGKEADLAVVLSRPRSTVMAGKLTDYRLRLHASPGYFAYKQMPRSTADLTRNHCLVGYIPDLPSDPTLRYLAELSAGLFATIRNSSINAQHLLVAAGAGIGVLPYFMSDRDRSLLPMKQGESIVLDRGPHATPVYSPASAPSSSGSSKWSRSSHRLAMRQ